MADKKTLREISSDLVQLNSAIDMPELDEDDRKEIQEIIDSLTTCLLYTSPSPRDP